MEDDYGDDDFEDYEDEDFEADDVDEAEPPEAAPAQPYLVQPAAPRAVKPSSSPTITRGPLGAGGANMGNIPPAAPRMPPPQQMPQQPAYELPPQRRFIAPPSQASSQLRQQRAERLKALLRPGVLQLRDVDITLYEAAPLTPYELQMRFGSRTMRAKTTQTGDKNPSVTVQTDEIEVASTAMQWPEDGPAAGTSAATLEVSESAKTESLMTANIGRLRRFLLSAGQVVETLCMENLMAVSGRAAGFDEPNALSHSQRHATLTLPPALGTRTAHDLTFDDKGGVLLACFSKPLHPMPHEGLGTNESGAAAAAAGSGGKEPPKRRDLHHLNRLATGGLLATWRLYRPDAPWAVMRCVGVPSCCLLPAAKPHLAFAGTDEGTVQVWNLREPGSSHPSVDMGDGDRLALRAPTYATDCLASAGAHVSPIVQLTVLPAASDDAELTIGSLDAEGTLILWVLLEAVDIDTTDLGQAVGSKERLLRTGTVPLTADLSVSPLAPPTRPPAAPLAVLPTRCLGMAFVPTDASRLLLATDLPHVLHKSRYVAAPGTPAAAPPTPAAYVPALAQACSSAAVGMAFCPTAPAFFVTGRTDGTVSLYHTDDARPLFAWSGFGTGAITQVAWSAARPSLVWAVDEAEVVHAIDITDPSGKPISSAKMYSGGRDGGGANGCGGDGANGGGQCAPKRPLRIALDPRPGEKGGAAAGRAGQELAQRLLATCSRNGDGVGVEVHVLTDKCAAPQPDEQAKLAHFLNRL